MKKSKSKKPAKKKSVKAKKVVRARKRVSAASPFYAQSKRLGFRLLEAGDEDLYVGLFTDAKTMQHVMPPLDKERAQRSFRKALEVTHQKPFKQHISVIVEKATRKTVGITSLKLIDSEGRRAEGGILLKTSAHQKRYSVEAIHVTNKEAFKWFALDEISARVPVGHKAGESLVARLGFLPREGVADEQPIKSNWVLSRDAWARNTK